MFLGSQDAAEEAKRQCEHGFRLRESEDELDENCEIIYVKLSAQIIVTSLWPPWNNGQQGESSPNGPTFHVSEISQFT